MTRGDRIKLLRLSRGLSQEKLGALLGVSGPAVSAWESGSTENLRIENFLRLCAMFGCTPHWLAFGEEGAPWEKSLRKNDDPTGTDT